MTGSLPTLRPEPVWARTSPALFPVCLGLIGAGLAWREAGRGSALASAMAEAWLGAALAVFAVCALLYLRKIAARPAALLHDLRMPAGRGAVPALSVAAMLAGAALAPVAPGAALALWGGAVVLHLAIVALLTRTLLAMPPEGRPATAPLLLPYAGTLVAPLGGATLGYPGLSWALLALGVAGWLVLLPFILRRLATAGAAPPPPLRPGAAVQLSPPAVTALALDRLGGPEWLQLLCWLLALATLGGLLWRWRWLTAGGWTPAWGAFTFPLTAFAAATAATLSGTVGLTATAVAVTSASLVVLYVAGRTAEAWGKGRLAS